MNDEQQYNAGYADGYTAALKEMEEQWGSLSPADADDILEVAGSSPYKALSPETKKKLRALADAPPSSAAKEG